MEMNKIKFVAVALVFISVVLFSGCIYEEQESDHVNDSDNDFDYIESCVEMSVSVPYKSIVNCLITSTSDFNGVSRGCFVLEDTNDNNQTVLVNFGGDVGLNDHMKCSFIKSGKLSDYYCGLVDYIIPMCFIDGDSLDPSESYVNVFLFEKIKQDRLWCE